MQRIVHLVIALALSGLMASRVAAQAPAPEPGSEATRARDAIRNLHWLPGPQTVRLFDLATLDVPQGYMFLNPEEAAKFAELTQNLASDREYVLAPTDLRWIAYWRFNDVGYVKDEEKIDANAILGSIKEGTEAANGERRRRGFPELTIVGWKQPPAYEAKSHRLEWAIEGRDSNNDGVINFNTRILGRRGVTSATLVADPEELDSFIGEFKSAIGSYGYLQEERYAAFRPGDKIAEYGLAALITGGAAAVATKTGFWKTLAVTLAAAWKAVIAGLAALVAFIRNLLTRRQAKAEDAVQP